MLAQSCNAQSIAVRVPAASCTANAGNATREHGARCANQVDLCLGNVRQILGSLPDAACFSFREHHDPAISVIPPIISHNQLRTIKRLVDYS